MADVTSRLPTPISSRLADISSQIANRAGRAVDYAIAGIPFMSATSPEDPLIDETADMRKDQFDSEAEPGEQSLQGWWLRSQDSWHHGAGAKFQESRTSTAPSARFYDSSGIDPWTEGELKLLRKMVQATPTGSEATCLYHTSDGLFLGVGAEVRQATTIGGTTTSLATATNGTFQDLVAGKSSWYGVTSTGHVYTRALAGGALSEYPLDNADTEIFTSPRLAWAKHRLWATWGRRVYVVDTSKPSGTTVSPLYSHPTLDWSYADIAEGPSCVYLAGWSEAESSIQKVVLQDDGSIPTLSAGVTTAILPRGERVQRIAVLAGTWIGIATNKGFRVGAIDSNGDIQYGPLFLRPENAIEAVAITAFDRFFYVSWKTSDSKACVYRVDVSQQPEDDGAFAWARDAETSSPGAFTDLAVVEDGRVVAAFNSGAAAKYWYQHETELVETGFIEFGKIRFRTTEPKLFKYVIVDVEPLNGSIEMDAVLPTDTLARLRILNEEGKGEFEQSEFPTVIGPQRSLGLKFTFNRSTTDVTKGPVLHSYTVKAIPAVKPQRLIQLPLLCFDRERWSTGQEDGYDGFAKERLEALKAIEAKGDLVLLQEFAAESTFGRQVKLESVRFVQKAPPHASQTKRGYGGIVTLLLRTMD